MRQGGDSRGNSRDRARSKLWLLSPEAGFGGDGETVPCVHCDTELTFATLERDRIIPGRLGGRYTRDNLQPSCRSCNASRGGQTDWASPRQKVVMQPA